MSDDLYLVNNVEVVPLVPLSDDDLPRDGGVREHCVKNIRSLILVQMAEQHVFCDSLRE